MASSTMYCGSRVTAFQGSRLGVSARVGHATRGVAAAVMRKKDIHPEWYPTAPVICNGVEVMTVGGTKPKYNVDIYSGNHPFYQGNKTFLVMDDGQLNKFKKRFALDDADELSVVPVLQAGKPEEEKSSKPAPAAAKKGGKKK